MRRHIAGIVCVLAALAVSAPAALAHLGNANYRSIINSFTPRITGVTLDVLNFDDRLLLTNRSSQTVTVEGYNGEPYIRILPSGLVQLNRLSPAKYLNEFEARTSEGSVPAYANAKAAPQWQTVDKTGQYQWHDHRIHYMAAGTPPQVKNKKVKTRVFNWKVPVSVGNRAGAIDGTLYWVPGDDSGLPSWAIALLAVIVIGGGAAMIRVRRRRDEAADAESGEREGRVEAW